MGWSPVVLERYCVAASSSEVKSGGRQFLKIVVASFQNRGREFSKKGGTHILTFELSKLPPVQIGRKSPYFDLCLRRFFDTSWPPRVIGHDHQTVPLQFDGRAPPI